MSRIGRTNFLLASCVLLAAYSCGHTQAAHPAPGKSTTVNAEASSVAPDAVPAAASMPPSAAEPAQDAGPAPAAVAAGPAPKIEAESIGDFMGDHFQIAAWARDSVVDGNLEALREPLQALAAYHYDSVVPGGWMRGVAQLQEASRVTAQASTLAAAASGVAAMARVCGDCHRAEGKGPSVPRHTVETRTPKTDRVTTRMYRHVWAAHRLWEGLVAPSDQAWQAGAAALAHAPERTPKLRPAPEGFAQALAEIRGLGVRALAAESLDDRINVYGLMLATCAHCHAYNAVFEF